MDVDLLKKLTRNFLVSKKNISPDEKVLVLNNIYITIDEKTEFIWDAIDGKKHGKKLVQLFAGRFQCATNDAIAIVGFAILRLQELKFIL